MLGVDLADIVSITSQLFGLAPCPHQTITAYFPFSTPVAHCGLPIFPL
jgi:hypothetical protein